VLELKHKGLREFVVLFQQMAGSTQQTRRDPKAIPIENLLAITVHSDLVIEKLNSFRILA
jgi:hypothetical protein